MTLHELALAFFQNGILLYFLAINLIYTVFVAVSFRYIVKFGFTGSTYTIKSLLNGVFYRPLSIIVPAYNEEDTILASVRSLLNLHFPEFEVIVVSDGSKDLTIARLIDEFDLVQVQRPIRLQVKHQPIRKVYLSEHYPNLLVIDKDNGGKADAINAGINASSFPLFCCLDADSLLENDAILRAVKPFVEDRQVIATGGIVRILNGCTVEHGKVTEVKAPKTALETLQVIEYLRGFISGRTAWNIFGSLLIISGAFGIFRKDMVIAIGGYRHTVGEDMDLVVRLHKHCRDRNIPYKILFVPDPVCFTQAPNDLKSLLKQRNRWQRGLIDSLRFSKEMFLNPRYGTVGLLGFPYFVVVEAMGPVIEFAGYGGFIVLCSMGVINREFAILFLSIAVLWGLWLNIAVLVLDNILFASHKSLRDTAKFCWYSLVEMLGYRQFICLQRLLATFQLWNKGWGQPKRSKI